MGSAIKILFFVVFFGVWVVKIAKKFSEMKNAQSRTSYSPQRRPSEEFPKLDFERNQETHQAPKEPVYEANRDAVRGFLKELDLVKEEKSQESINRLFEQAPEEEYTQPELVEEEYIQPELIKNEFEEIPEEEFKKPVEKKLEIISEVASEEDYSWKSEEITSTLSVGISDAKMGIIMSEILGKPIALR